MSESGASALDGFLDKWRRRWPEWTVAETFLPPAQRVPAVVWFALLQEFEDAANVDGDPLPADAKLAWWGEELRDWSRRRSRHPLGRVLEPMPAPWMALSDALPALVAARARPVDEAAAFAQWAPLAQAAAAVEGALFDPVAGGPQAHVEAIRMQWLAARLMAAGEGATPSTPSVAAEAWARQLRRRWPVRPAAPMPRRVLSALARARLGRFRGTGAGVPALAPLPTLWLAWRAASR